MMGLVVVRSSKLHKRVNTSKKWAMIGVAFIVLMTLMCYLPAIRGGYVWDDDYYVTNNLTLRTLDGLRRIWFEIGAVPQYYPLVHTSFWIEYHLWELNPLGFHLVNVVLHALNAILLWLLLRCLSVPGAWLAAVIFALHPVHVESVAWITERKNVLSGYFYLSAILAYIRFLRLDVNPSSTSSSSAQHPPTSAISRYHWGFYALALALYLFALLSKTVTCTMPAAILLLLWWKHDRISWRSMLLLIPHFILGFVFSLTTVWMEKHSVGTQGEVWALSLVERCLIAGRALWFYAAKLFWPRKLIFTYPRWQIDVGIWWQYLFPLAAVAVFIALWLLREKIGKAPLIAVLFFAGTLAPALGFFDIYPMRYSFVADHFQYLASIGLIVLCITIITTIFRRLGPMHRTIGCAAYGVMILVLGMLVWQQGCIYKDVETLWRDTISKNPNAWMAYNNLGTVLRSQGKLNEAIKHYQKSLTINPNNEAPHNNLGNIYAKKGWLDKAISEYKKAIVIKPNHVKGHTNLGLAYFRKGMLDKAIAEYKKALTANPNFAMARTNLGLAYEKTGMLDKAIAEHKKALAINPNSANAHLNLGVAYHRKGILERAILEYRKTLSIDPDYAGAYTNLGKAYEKKGMVDKAIAEHKKALAINPNLTNAHNNLGSAYSKKGMWEEAIVEYKKVLAAKPKSGRTHYNLSVAYYKKGNYLQAIAHCNKAVERGYKVRSQFLKKLEAYR